VARLREARVHVGDEPVEHQEHDSSDSEAEDHLRHRPEVEGRHEQAEGGGREHDPGGEAEQAVEEALGRVAHDEQREAADPGRGAGGEDPGERLGVYGRQAYEARRIGTSPQGESAGAPIRLRRGRAILILDEFAERR